MAVLSGAVLQQTAARFALLGDPTRLQLLGLLLERADYTVGELAAAAGVSVANASQHLRRLEAGGILGRRRIGNTVQYRVVEASIEQLCAIVCASVQERARVLVAPDTIE
ncbi:metalloregulator ArsR/SmtB family transcription factor [Actinoplanes sp. NPDC049316]|uniref:ArsR/SmtB family transcription factor n=1 Tax=Actinoplanes sp. NPDC049316 TaxID=3154727 RepID=UPI003426429F